MIAITTAHRPVDQPPDQRIMFAFYRTHETVMVLGVNGLLENGELLRRSLVLRRRR